MAEWIPPKTNWQVEDVPGVGDFERSERNAEYLKGQTDGLKNGSITAGKATNANNADTVDGYHADEIWTRVRPSNTIILSSTSHSSAESTDYSIAKQFRVRYPGRYRITFDVAGLAKVKVTVDEQTQGIEMDPAPSTVTLGLPHVPWGGIITVYIAKKGEQLSASIYNCHLRGTIFISRPRNLVLVE